MGENWIRSGWVSWDDMRYGIGEEGQRVAVDWRVLSRRHRVHLQVYDSGSRYKTIM